MARPTKRAKAMVADAQKMEPLLANRQPEEQGAILAQLVSTWLAGFRPDVRPLVFSDWADLVHRLVPIQAALADVWQEKK